MDQEPHTISREQKIGAVALGIFVVIAFVMIVYSFYVRIQRPFQMRTAQVLSEIETLRTQSRIADALGVGSTGDTDADGLSDADELTLYKTSPYLDDTDADGITDGKEVEAGSDPNCPAGTVCPEDSFQSPAGQGEGTSAEFETPGLNPEVRALLSQVQNPADVREILLQLGVAEATLALYDDETLLELYQQALQESGSKPAPTLPIQAPSQGSAAGAQGPAELFAGLQNPNEVRQFLLKNGIPQKVIDALNDEELMKAFQKSLEQFNL